MCCFGHKGAMGWPENAPQWIIDIIKFRNDKYAEDIKKGIGDKISIEMVDRKYDKIDNAIFNLNNLHDNSVKGCKGTIGIIG